MNCRASVMANVPLNYIKISREWDIGYNSNHSRSFLNTLITRKQGNNTPCIAVNIAREGCAASPPTIDRRREHGEHGDPVQYDHLGTWEWRTKVHRKSRTPHKRAREQFKDRLTHLPLTTSNFTTQSRSFYEILTVATANYSPCYLLSLSFSSYVIA